MTDRELLEAAAKAAGMEVSESNSGGLMCWENAQRDIGGWWTAWNPLTDDGDALRLAVKLELHIRIWDSESECGPFTNVPHGNDPYAATRRAVVRAAAELGRGE